MKTTKGMNSDVRRTLMAYFIEKREKLVNHEQKKSMNSDVRSTLMAYFIKKR